MSESQTGMFVASGVRATYSSTAINMNMSIRSGYQGILAAFLLLFISCKKEYNEFYARPENLEQPIYQQLTASGRFKSLTTLIEKAGYKETLSSAGYWTLFAPHDSAFAVFFKERGLAGAEARLTC